MRDKQFSDTDTALVKHPDTEAVEAKGVGENIFLIWTLQSILPECQPVMCKPAVKGADRFGKDTKKIVEINLGGRV